MITCNLFNISKTDHLFFHQDSVQISINVISRTPGFLRDPSALGMPVQLLAKCENGIRWQLREQKKISPKVTRQKGKADAPEAQGQMSRKSIYHLRTLRLEDEGDEPVHGRMKSQEGRIQLIAH